jgi:hypothetical protein
MGNLLLEISHKAVKRLLSRVGTISNCMAHESSEILVGGEIGDVIFVKGHCHVTERREQKGREPTY